MVDLHAGSLTLFAITDSNTSFPEGINPVDAASLIKCYLASLPEPLTTFELYNEIRGARSSIHMMSNILKKLPNVNYMTLEFVTALLLRVSQKSLLNKASNTSLSFTLVHLLMQTTTHLREGIYSLSCRPSTNKDCVLCACDDHHCFACASIRHTC